MVKKIAFYISDHNMEHVLRNIPVLRNILKLENDLELYVKSGSRQIELIEERIRDEHLHCYAMEMKDRQIDEWDALAETEEMFLKDEQIGLVVSDICPWIFLAADELRIRSLFLGHYSWAELCENEEEREEYLSCYELAHRMFLYDLHGPQMREYGVEYDLMSMTNDPYHMEMIESMETKLGAPVLFLDVSGEELDLSGLPYAFVVTEQTSVKTDENQKQILLSDYDKDLHNYIGASRYVITEGNWNRIAQTVLANRKGAFLVKEDVPLSEKMISLLEEREQGMRIRAEDLSNMKELLEKLDDFQYSYEHEYYNCDYDLAKKILFSYPEKRRRNRS